MNGKRYVGLLFALPVAAASLIALAGDEPARGGDDPAAPERPADPEAAPIPRPAAAPRAERDAPELTPEARQKIARGLKYLADSQSRAGSWHGGEYPIAVTALCGLALLGSGSTPTSGPYAENVRRAMSYLLQRQLKHSGVFLEGNDSRYMYGHGFTLLFLAECYGMSGNFVVDGRPLDRAIRDAVKYTASWQTDEGGWYYTGTRDEDEGSVTITQIQGLRAARNAGFKVDRSTIDRAIDYIRKSQDPDGGVRYTSRYGRSSLALTGAGLAVLYGAGDYESKNVEKALEYVRSHMDFGPETAHFHYTHFYVAQAMHQHGGADWTSYFPQIRAELLRSQSSGGFWSSTYGRAYATALSLLILEIPYRYLPIYER